MIAKLGILLVALVFTGDVSSRSLDSIASCDNRFIINYQDGFKMTLKNKKKYQEYISATS
jgi:hypothetical protein